MCVCGGGGVLRYKEKFQSKPSVQDLRLLVTFGGESLNFDQPHFSPDISVVCIIDM